MAGILSRIILSTRRSRQMKQETLAHSLGCSRSYVSKIERGKTIPSLLLARKIEESLHLKQGKLVQPLLEIRLSEKVLKRKAVVLARSGQAKLMMDGHVLVPLHAASRRWNDRIVQYIAIPKTEIEGKKMFFMKAYDDSMNKCGINRGDLILIEIRDVKNNEICMYGFGKEWFIRYYRKKDGRIRMMPNSTRRTKTVFFKGGSDIRIQGVLKGIIFKGRKKRIVKLVPDKRRLP